VSRGAEIIVPATIERIEPHGDGWRIDIAHGSEVMTIDAMMVIDAAGRAAPIARRARRPILETPSRAPLLRAPA
jgi:flavin-dependent dehydrogenase